MYMHDDTDTDTDTGKKVPVPVPVTDEHHFRHRYGVHKFFAGPVGREQLPVGNMKWKLVQQVVVGDEADEAQFWGGVDGRDEHMQEGQGRGRGNRNRNRNGEGEGSSQASTSNWGSAPPSVFEGWYRVDDVEMGGC
ncbi:hypothetical protein B0T09DRAFT_155500 [Sordaria sp. MPI-SDFR-AT-0083]|nr:hypothetical protein B0T09DRAFT_155500 [Sordaria sp. MPI-SDFR-AT-0083]